MSHKCTSPGCDYTAKTSGAITNHVRRAHGNDPMAKLRNTIPGAPRPGGVFGERPLRAAPSGVPSIDYAIGIGGIPRGGIVEIFGPSASGKSFTALTFSAYAQQMGGRAGYMNAERAPMETFLPLIPGLDVGALEYGEPPVAGEGASKDDQALWDGTGEAVLEVSRRFIKTRAYDIWTIDSVASLTPRQALGLPIGSRQANAALARLMREAVGILEHEIRSTATACIFVNHVTAVPQAGRFERKWSKPGGSALDYYASLHLEVRRGKSYFDSNRRQIGHVVKVKVTKSKVAQPFMVGEYDLFYGSGVLIGEQERGRVVTPGIDVVSSWISVLKESDTIKWVGSNYFLVATGEQIGPDSAVREQVMDHRSELFRHARELVYPDRFRNAQAA